MNRKQRLILLGGTLLLGFAFAWAFNVPRTVTAVQLQPGLQTEADTNVCALSDKQQEASIQKFSELMPVFTHPRCINCHGALNPFAANTTHVGGRIGLKFEERTVRDNILGRDVTVIEPEDQLTLRLCQDCHSEAPAWSPPPPQKWFVGKNTVQLCEQLKDQSNNDTDSFLSHIEHDSLDLIPAAFRGTRGLDENGRGIFEQDTGKEFRPEPPPVSHEMFIARAKAWLEAMGGHFKPGYTCGCEPHHYVLKGSFDEVWTKEDGPLHFKGHGEMQIPIQFNDDGSFSGETSIDVNETNTWTASTMTCTDSLAYSGVRWKVNGAVDRIDMHATFVIQFPPTEMKSVCTAMNVTTNNSEPNIRPEQNMDFTDVVQVGETFTIEDNLPIGYSLKAQFRVVEEGK